MVADDSASIAGEIRDFAEFGYEVLTTVGDLHVLKLLVDNPRVGIVVLDLDLGNGIDSMQTARDLLAHRSLPILFRSAKLDRTAYDRVQQISHYGLISKNSGFFVLLSAVEAAYRLFEEHQYHLLNEKRFNEFSETMNRQAQELALLDQARLAIVRDVDLDAVIHNTVEGIAQIFGYSLVSLYLLRGITLFLQHYVGYDNIRTEIPITQGVIGRVIRTGQAILLKDVHKDPDFLGASPDIACEVCVPILDGKQVVGAFNIECNKEMELTDQDLHLLTALGEHISIAIGHARLYAKITENARFLLLLNDIAHAALQAGDLDDMLQVVADRMGELLNADGCVLTLWDDARHKVIPASTYGTLLEIFKTLQFEPGEVSLTESVLSSGAPIIIEDVFTSPLIKSQVAAKLPARSVLGLPLIADMRKLGAIMISFSQPHKFTSEEISRSVQAANQIALAIAKSQLAVTDHMTQAYNRRGLFEFGKREIERARRYQSSLSAIMLDVDHFKLINDRYSHTAGDQVLIDIVVRIHNNIRSMDLLGRYGGEEFTVFLPECNLEAAVRTAERLCTCINEFSDPHGTR